MASKNLSTTLKTIAQQWPLDKLRPTLQFSGALKSANDRTFSISPSTPGNGKGVETSGGGGKVEGERILSEKEAKKAEEMINSLNRILANDALKSYPMSPLTLEPLSFPKHYKRLREGILKGESGEIVERGDSWKNWFRWNQ